MYAYPPLYQAAWPPTPIWHPPAEMREVVYPSPGPYARRKDARMGSLAMASLSAPMMSMGFYGAAGPSPADPVQKKQIAKEKPQADKKPVGKQIASFFKKDASGTSKAEKVAARALELASKKQSAPAPAPIVVQAPSAPAAPAAPAGVSPIQLALVGLVAVGVGVGVGYAFGRTR
jgi:hypothetical protein